MSGMFRSKLLSAMCISALSFGVMVVIVQEGPEELPYYDGTLRGPLTSPRIEQLYYAPETDAAEVEDHAEAEYEQGAADEDGAYHAGSQTYDTGAEATGDESEYSTYTSRAE